jgi:O-antigen/teichoic acid export membrane protein
MAGEVVDLAPANRTITCAAHDRSDLIVSNAQASDNWVDRRSMSPTQGADTDQAASSAGWGPLGIRASPSSGSDNLKHLPCSGMNSQEPLPAFAKEGILNRLRSTVIKNSLANMVRGGASAIVALVLPHFLTRALDHDRFAAWALMLQIAAYANYLDFGLQTAVARFLAQAIERRDEEQRDQLISTTFAMLCVGALVSALAIGAVVFFLPNLFHQAPSSLFGELRAGIVVLAISAALLLPLSTFTGVLVGLYRNELPAFAIGASRLLGAVLVIFAVSHTHSLVVLAALTASCNLAGGLVQYFMARRLLPKMRVALSLATKAMAAELAKYCSTLTIWSLGMLLVTGLDVTIVAHYDFAAVGAYSVAAVFVAFLVGVNNSVYTAMLAPLAVLQERGEWRRIGNLVVTVTRLTNFFDTIAILIVFLCGHSLLRFWVGETYAIQALPILKILIIANAIRLIGAPLSAALVATNQQHFGISGAIIEGISNFVLSIAGAMLVGAVGVALGTLASACIGILWVLLLMIRWLKIPIVSRATLLMDGCLRPVICLLPFIICVASFNQLLGTNLRSLMIATAMIATAVITWRWGKVWQSHAESAA